MVEVEVNPANVTVSKFPPHEDVFQLFTAEWPIAQKAAGTSQQNKEKEQETHKVAFCRVEITNRFSTLEHISQEAEIKETKVCPQHRGDSKWYTELRNGAIFLHTVTTFRFIRVN